MALDHRTKVFAVKQARLSLLVADWPTAPAAPSAPAAPTVTPITSGSTSYSYTVALSNGVDSSFSTAGSTATGAATPNNTVTLGAAVPAGQVGIVRRTVGGTTQGVVGYIAPGGTSFVDNNITATTYVANTSGLAYGPSMPIPGAKAVKVTGSVTTQDLRGDNTLLDSDTMLTGVAVELDYAKLSLDLLSAMLGGTVTDSGSTPSQASTWSLPDPPVFAYWKLEARAFAVDAPNGDLHLLFPKMKLADFPQLGLAEEAYQMQALKCKAVPTLSGAQWLQVTLNETAIAIS